MRRNRPLLPLLAALALAAVSCTLEEKRPAPADTAKPASTDTMRRAPVRALAALGEERG